MFAEWTKQNYPAAVHDQLLTVLKQFDTLLALGDKTAPANANNKGDMVRSFLLCVCCVCMWA